ncbi:hypothetical protein O3G_MSEX001379 [Manduca sexta]|uniref:Uncharacterized protein n=1 Tax=Manduca sexta TaxID=7130 RepID=A0A922CCI1_MANSE|nr:hypothetical protein O3G_MSEX001379 [Manduca sexta]
MSYCNSNSSISSIKSYSPKIQGLESTLQQSIVHFKEIVLDFEQLYIESENFKTQLQLQKQMCESKTCRSSDELKKDLETKNNILQALAFKLTLLYETKDFNLINEAFQIICGDLNVHQPVLKTSPKSQESETVTSNEEVNDETLNEIEGTPTGHTSPIIQSKKTKMSTSSKSSDFRDKKKCPDTW